VYVCRTMGCDLSGSEIAETVYCVVDVVQMFGM